MVFEKVSIIIPTYNYAQFITEAIDSVINQNYPQDKIEIIVIDDGSTDNTIEVLQPYILKGMITYHNQKNKGKANATNSAIDICTGKYIFNLDADDYFYPNKIVETVRIFEEDSSLVHVASPANFVDFYTNNCEAEKLPKDILGKSLNGTWLLKRFYNSNILFGGGTTFAARSSVLKEISIPDEVDMYIDEFLILAVLPFGNSYFYQEPLSVWRVHKNNYSNNSDVDDKFLKKAHRLLNSSKAVLQYLELNSTDKDLVKIYRLQDATRRISFREKINKKTAKNIFDYAKEVFFDIQPQWHLVNNYKVINRLIPSSIFNLLKKVNS